MMELFHGLGAAIAALVLSVTSAVGTGAAPAGVARADRVDRAPTVAVLPGRCEAKPLPVPDGVVTSRVTGGDHSGRYLVGTGSRADGTQVYLWWRDGRVATVDTSALPANVNVELTDISAAGIVGHVMVSGQTFRTEAFVIRAGKVTMLTGLRATDATRAAAINARGDIIGTSENDIGELTRHAVTWPASRPGTVRELVADGPAPTWTFGVDIDDDGTALGFVGRRPSAEQHPYVWPAVGPGRALAGPAGYTYPDAAAVHAGWVAGLANNLEGRSEPVRWRLATGRATALPGGTGAAVDVNALGTVADVTAVIHLNGRVRTVAGYLKVIDDRGVVAGSTDPFFGTATTWAGC